jgi:hypothetical protein
MIEHFDYFTCPHEEALGHFNEYRLGVDKLGGDPSSPLRVGYLTCPYLSHLVRPAPWWCALLVLQLCSGFATAQQNITQAPPTPTPQLHFQAIPGGLLTNEIVAPKEIKEKDGQFLMGYGLPETPKMLEAREEYTVYAWKNREAAFAWQSISTKVIFLLVIIVVLTGLYLSWMQFNFAHKAPMKLTRPSTEASPIEQSPDKQVDPENTTIEVNTSGMTITSSVIGLIILALSIVFFFLYLKFVYPIITV